MQLVAHKRLACHSTQHHCKGRPQSNCQQKPKQRSSPDCCVEAAIQHQVGVRLDAQPVEAVLGEQAAAGASGGGARPAWGWLSAAHTQRTMKECHMPPAGAGSRNRHALPPCGPRTVCCCAVAASASPGCMRLMRTATVVSETLLTTQAAAQSPSREDTFQCE